jgi:hypothetical protein
VPGVSEGAGGLSAEAGGPVIDSAEPEAESSGSVLDLAERIVLGPGFRSAPWGSWRGPERNLVNVAMIARERDGRSGPIGMRERIGLLAGMGALRERLAAAGVG